MGVLNVTPDSFSDGGHFTDTDRALEHAVSMRENGADIIDIGGESTRPGAEQISATEEIKRVIPVLKKIKAAAPDIILSIDTTKPETASAALSEGADIINDISGLRSAPEIAEIAAEYKAGLILMHMRGTPANMKELCNYDNLIEEIKEFLENSANYAIKHGVAEESIIIDPGIGFAKNTLQNLEIIRRFAEFAKSGYPLLAGPSRKSFIGEVLDEANPAERIWGTAGAVAFLAAQRVDFIRVHDLKEMHDVVNLVNSILYRMEKV